ncbi:hypothetical protein [Proteiniphilum sp.]|uniref:hypothetical protein n=1 Tax=Proteiniphilum sp. TaxID=1926877 RepID=UPI003321964D
MTKQELEIHLSHTRKMLQDINDLDDRITTDYSDDATNIRRSYENVRKELRYLLARQYDNE